VNGKMVRIAQINNSYIFPGLALGILVSKARRVTDGMIMAAAKTLASLSPARADKDAALLPPIADSRKVGLVVGEAVALQAIADGVAEGGGEETLKDRLRDYVWEPVYLPYERIP
jgi:malate dehydrogenase (oxaloacetate-decarboxylating)